MTDGRTDQPQWGGIHHLALVTDDMDATVRFWHGVLGANLVATIGAPTFRHYFFDVGPGLSVAFFEYRGDHADRFAKPAGIFDPRATQFDHLSLHLPDEAALEALRERLEAHGCGVTEVVDHDIMRSIYFTDPNGIALEASWWVLDPTGSPPALEDPRLFGDTEPVAAVKELMADGELLSTPATALVDEATPPA